MKDYTDPTEASEEEIRKIIQTASTRDNELDFEAFIPPSASESGEAAAVQQDGLVVDRDSLQPGVVRAKVVEDTSYARSISNTGGGYSGDPGSVGIAAIISIVIGVLALICFSLMIFLAMARRRRAATAELAPSSSAYTATSRYTPDNSESNMSDMKATYMEELSPNVSSSSLERREEVVIPMDGHQTIIGSYEEFLDVTPGARPNILQCLPVSPAAVGGEVMRTVEMRDPELAFSPPAPARPGYLT